MKDAYKVYAVELCKDAVQAAEEHAKKLMCDNYCVFQGKAEDHIENMVTRAGKYRTVAIVDPPRAGLREYNAMIELPFTNIGKS